MSILMISEVTIGKKSGMRFHPPLLAVLALLLLTLTAEAQSEPYTTRLVFGTIDTNKCLYMPGGDDLVTAQGAPYTIARVFKTSLGAPRLFLLSGISGDFAVFEIQNGVAVNVSQSGTLSTRGWRAAEFVYNGATPTLFLFDHRDGRIAEHAISLTGDVQTPGVLSSADELKRKTLFDSFIAGPGHRLFALDPNTGDTTIGQLPLGTSIDAPHTFGWTDVDHAEVDGLEHRLLYKGAGQPHLPPGELHRMVLQSVAPSGLAALTHNLNPGGDPFTKVMFYPIDDVEVGVFGYRRDGLKSAFWPLDGSVTHYHLAQACETTSININLDEVLIYRDNGETHLIGVIFDNDIAPVQKLNGDKAARFAACVDAQLTGRAVGYQLAVLQNGEVLIDRAEGAREIGPSEKPMLRDTHIPIGSVSKLITTLTALHLDGDGALNVESSVASHYANTSDFDSWTFLRRPLDLMAHSTGHNGDSRPCVASADDAFDCTAFFESPAPAADDCDAPAIGLTCPYKYVNANISALRAIIEESTGATGSDEVTALTQSEWMNAVVPNGPTCENLPESSMYFGPCGPGGLCIEYQGRSWIQSESPNYENGWSKFCAAGGWEASALDVAQIIEAARGEQILSAQRTSDFFSVWDISTGGDSALGWDRAVDVLDIADVFRKGGTGTESDTGAGYRAGIIHTSGNAQAALNVNTSEEITPRPTNVLREAYEYATGQDDCLPIITIDKRGSNQVANAKRDTYAVAHVDENIVMTASRIVGGWSGHLPKDGLELRTFQRNEDGSLKQLDRFDLGQYADRLQSFIRLHPLKNRRVVAAMRTQSGRFQVLLVSVSAAGIISEKYFHEPSGGAGDATIVPTDAADDRFAIVRFKNNGALSVAGWRFNELTNKLVRNSPGAYETAGPVLEVDAASGPNEGDVLVVVRTASGKAKPIFFTVDEDDAVERHASAESSQQYDGSNIRIARVSVDGGAKFVVAQKTPSGNLFLSSWTADQTSVDRIWSNLGASLIPIQSIGAQIVGGLRNIVAIPVRFQNDQGDVVGDIRYYRMWTSGSLSEKANNELGACSEISLASGTTGAQSALTPTRYFVTSAHRASDGKMRLGEYEVHFGGDLD